MEPEILISMSARLEIERHPKDYVVFRQDDLGKKYYILLDGQCSVLVGKIPVAWLRQG